MVSRSTRAGKRLPPRRLSRRELKRDPFVDRVFEAALWSRENLRRLAVVLAGLLLVLLAILLYRGSRAGESRRAAERFQEIWQAYGAGNYQLAANDFRQFRVQYRGTEYVDDATVYLANSYIQAGDHPAAIKVLEEFRRDYGDSPLAGAAEALLASAYESSGDRVKAAAAYERARQKATYEFEEVNALMGVARTHAAAGSHEKAAAAYREVVESYSESPRAQEARVRLAELTAKPLRKDPVSASVAPASADSGGAAALEEAARSESSPAAPAPTPAPGAKAGKNKGAGPPAGEGGSSGER